MKENFKTSLAFVLKWEGRYVNDPKDPGGESKFGISKRAYPLLDIKNLTVEQATEIYYQDYWVRAGCDELAWPFDLIMLDTSINCGLSQATRFFAKGHNWRDILIARIEFYEDLNRPAFLYGWIRRVVDLYNTCKETK